MLWRMLRYGAWDEGGCSVRGWTSDSAAQSPHPQATGWPSFLGQALVFSLPGRPVAISGQGEA